MTCPAPYLPVKQLYPSIHLMKRREAIVFCGRLLSSVMLYVLVDVGFSDRYAENLSIASLFISEIKTKSVYIFVGLGVVAFLAALGFSVYFSHKTAGPSM